MSEHYHLIGIGGTGMSAIAQILKERGAEVSGSDQRTSDVTQRLQYMGIDVKIGHEAKNVNGASFVIYSAAISPQNPERMEAERREIITVERSKMLGRLMDEYRTRIAIAGTHGKTTTTSMATLILMEAGMDPTVLMGGDLDAIGGNARTGHSDVFLAEACEAFSSFLELRPSMAAVTNIDADHMDHYKSMDGVMAAFRQFLGNTDPDGTLVLCKDDKYVRSLLPELNRRVVTYSVKEPADVWANNITLGKKASYDLMKGKDNLGRIQIELPGLHYIANSLAAAIVGLESGASFEQVRIGLANYHGTERRFEVLGEAQGITVVDDYAHHPNEVRATLEAANTAYDGRVIAVFQPHLYSRTQLFCKEFADALSIADHTIVSEIFPSRETPIEGVSGSLIVEKMSGQAEFVAEKKDVPARAAELVQEGDVVIFMGAGDIREEAKALLEWLRK